MRDIIRKVYALLDESERKRAVIVLGLMLFVALFQMGAVTSIMPFMAMVADPGIVESDPRMAWFYEASGLQETGFLIFLGCVVLGAVVVGNGVGALVLWLSSRFLFGVNARLSTELLRRYINRPYLRFVQEGSANPGRNVLHEVDYFTRKFMKPMAELMAKGLTVLCLLGLIILVDWKVALIGAFWVGGSYGIIYFLLRERLKSLGQKRVVASGHRFKAVQEAFGAFKETKIFQCEEFFTKAYEKPTQKYSHYMVLKELAKQLPRHFLEVVAFGGLLVLVLYFLFTRDDFQQVIPILTVYVFAGYKLTPALQHCFASLTSMRTSQHVVDVLCDDYCLGDSVDEESKPHRSTVRKLPFQNEIRYENVTFSYPGGDHPVVSDLSITIPCHSMVAFCGLTGSGKTTVIDLLLGLFQPERGQILIDGIPLTKENLPRWLKNVGYVPQHIFLADETVARNIAFGQPHKKIDMEAVRRAARAAQIDDFLLNELPMGYDTVIGERGIRLSGGQRQRIGIARSLYHDPDVLIFDEATSALDGETENMVMDAIRNARKARTVIMIAHRLNTVKECDEIFLMTSGKIEKRGKYEELIQEDGSFRTKASASFSV